MVHIDDAPQRMLRWMDEMYPWPSNTTDPAYFIWWWRGGFLLLIPYLVVGFLLWSVQFLYEIFVEEVSDPSRNEVRRIVCFGCADRGLSLKQVMDSQLHDRGGPDEEHDFGDGLDYTCFFMHNAVDEQWFKTNERAFFHRIKGLEQIHYLPAHYGWLWRPLNVRRLIGAVLFSASLYSTCAIGWWFFPLSQILYIGFFTFMMNRCFNRQYNV